MQVNSKENESLLFYETKSNSENVSRQKNKNIIFSEAENESEQFKPVSWWEKVTQQYNDMQRKNQDVETKLEEKFGISDLEYEVKNGMLPQWILDIQKSNNETIKKLEDFLANPPAWFKECQKELKDISKE